MSTVHSKPCHCGQTHCACITEAFLGEDALARLNSAAAANGHRRLLLVCDTNTERHARRAQTALTCADTRLHVYADRDLVPDEKAVNALRDAVREGFDAYVAVGSGTLTDLTRYAAGQTGRPFYSVATAASMDGYASSVSPLILSGLKRTLPAPAPLAVAAVSEILSSAPPPMTAAGYGDMAGKFTSLNDWELEGLVTGGGFCPVLAGQMRGISEKLVSSEADAMAVMAALLDSGLVMQRAGHSKPASGAEHHLSHFWEMRALTTGRVPALHGAKVGVATLIMLRIAGWLMAETIDWERAERNAADFDRAAWAREMTAAYGRAAGETDGLAGVTALWPNENGGTRAAAVRRMGAVWPEIIRITRRNLPPYAVMEAGLRRMGCPLTPRDIGVNRAEFLAGVENACYVRERFTLLRAAHLLGLLPGYAARLAETFPCVD